MEESNISWTDITLNSVWGCSRVSEGCRNCYAERISNRYGHTTKPWIDEYAEENVSLKPGKLDEIRAVTSGSRVFVDSMSDLFHRQVPADYINQHASLFRETPRHVYQVLTKRSSRLRQLGISWPENTWMGVSVENDNHLDRISDLREVDAETKFVSFEPLIGPVGDVDLSGIDWVIVGGESGPDYRELRYEWVREIRDQAREYDAAFYFKQSAARHPERNPWLPVEHDGHVVERKYRETPPIPDVTKQARDQ